MMLLTSVFNKVSYLSFVQSLKRSWKRYLLFTALLLLAINLVLLPKYAENIIRSELIDAGYDNISMQPMQWHDTFSGLEFSALKASGKGLPVIDLGATSVWIEAARLWRGGLDVKLKSAVFSGSLQASLQQHMFSKHGNLALRIDDISIARLLADIPDSGHAVPFLEDKTLDGRFWLSATGQWENLDPLQVPININASLTELALHHQNKTQLFSMDKLQVKDLVYVAAEKSRMLLAAANIEASAIHALNAGLDISSPPFPLSIDHLGFTELSYSGAERFGLSEVKLQGLSVGKGEARLLYLAKLALQKLEFKQQKTLFVEDVVLQQGSLSAAKSRDGTWEPLHTFLAGLPKAGEKKTDIEQSSPLVMEIKRVRLEAVDVTFSDQTFERSRPFAATVKQADIHDLTLHKGDKPMSWKMGGAVGESATWRSEGSLWLDDVAKEMDTNLVVGALELAPFSGYLERKFGSGIQSGNMDANIMAKVRDDEVDISGVLLARKLILKKSESFLDTGKDWSLSAAVDVLRDSDNNVQLQLSATGKLSDPEFKFAGMWDKVLKQAVQSTAIGYLAQTMQPYGLAYAVGQYLYEQSKEIELRAFVFEQGSLMLTKNSPDFEGYSERIGNLLKKRPSYILEICPRFVEHEADEQELLSRDRVRELTHRLEAMGLPASRWTVCEPRLDEHKKASPRLTLRLI